MYLQENTLGAWYEIYVKVGIADKTIVNLSQTVDYAVLLDIVKQRFSITSPLLEQIVQDIEVEIRNRYSNLASIYISIKKLQPPLAADIESSEVILDKHYI